MRHRHQPIQCILPPHILDAIARNGSEEQRKFALDALAVDQSLRTLRAIRAPLSASVHPMAGAATCGQPHRTIFDAKHSQAQPPKGQIVRQEGGPAVGDAEADEAYDGLGATYKLYCDVFSRDSIDNHGLPLNAYVHYGTNYDNAFWDSQEMVFGDGDGKLFNRFTISVDVIGHELTHGVTENEAGLQYISQSGALNESISDVFGSLVKQHKLGQTANAADWLIGAGLLAKGVKGVALRSMKAPGTAYDDPVLGKDPQPANMSGYVHTISDNGGVHINSGIPNHAFYLVAVAIGGNAWEKAGHIWYETVRHPRLKPLTRFQGFARITHQVAARLYGAASSEAGAVADAWKQVGITA